MNAQHTPGPWHVFTEDGSVGTIEAENGVVVAQAQQTRSLRQDLKQVERRANARLIAAAPELLEALEYFKRHIGGDASCDLQTLLHLADAAIAKAKGA